MHHLQFCETFAASQTVHYNQFGEPVVLVMEHAPGHIECLRLGDPKFAEQLQLCGIAAAPPQVHRLGDAASISGK